MFAANGRLLALLMLLPILHALAAPMTPLKTPLQGDTLTTTRDEFGTMTRDSQGRLLLQENGFWFYAVIDSSGAIPHLVAHSSREAGIPDSLAAFVDPEILERVAAFNSHASQIVPVEGAIRITVIEVAVSMASYEPADTTNFWRFHGFPINQAKFYDQIFLQGYSTRYPNDINLGWYEVPGSANDWWLASSHGRSWLEPDTSRYPPGYTSPIPGRIVDPASGGPFIINAMPRDATLWALLAAAGIDITLDPHRPILLLGRGGELSHAHYGGWLYCELADADTPLTMGVIVHEMGHAVLQLPDLYHDTTYHYEPDNPWQMMNNGCYGYYNEAGGRFHRGYPSDLCAAFKQLIGWEQAIEITAPGEYFFDGDYVPFVIVSATDPRQRVYLRTWQPEGFMERHRPATEGRVLIEPSLVADPDWMFINKPHPFLLRPSENPWVDVWPFGQIDTPALSWEDGSWFPWNVRTCVGMDGYGRETTRLIVTARQAPDALVSMVHGPLHDEVPLGGVPITLDFLNLGVSFAGWEIQMGAESVAGDDSVSFNQGFSATFSAAVWNADVLGATLDLPVLLRAGAGELVEIGRLRPIVGMLPAGIEIELVDGAIVESQGTLLAVAEGSRVACFRNGVDIGSVEFAAPITQMCFGGEELAVAGTNWTALCRTDGSLQLREGWPQTFPDQISRVSLCTLPELGISLAVASGDRLQFHPLDGSPHTSIMLPDFVVPANGLAVATGDPGGGPGSRFCLTGGVLGNTLYITNLMGDSLFAHCAGDFGLMRSPLAMDLLGSGSYQFVAIELVNDDSWGVCDEIIRTCFLLQNGNYGTQVFELSVAEPGFAGGTETLVPFHFSEAPSREALILQDYNQHANSATAIRLVDLAHSEPEFRLLAGVEPLRRWFNTGEFTGDNLSDILMVERGRGVRLWAGAGGLDFSDRGLIHLSNEANFRPVYWQVDGNLLLGFLESGTLRFFATGAIHWPRWTRDGGEGNSGLRINESWTSPAGPPEPPALSVHYQPSSGHFDLRIEALPPWQQVARLSIWRSKELDDWTRLARFAWDGGADASWTDRQILQERNSAAFRVTVDNVPDAESVWTNP